MYRIIDRLEEDYDYGTGPVHGDDIFDTKTLGGFSFIAQAIPGNKDEEYMKKAKNRVGKIVMMSPKEYYDICARRFHTTPEELRRQRGYDRDYIEKLKEVITEKKVKFPMTFIDLTSEGSQEGLHRMLVAAELFGWDHRFPVLIVDWFDKEKHEREVKEEEQWRKYNLIERALMESLYYSYSSIDEFKDQLEIELQKELDGSNYPEKIPFELKLDGDNSYIIVDEIKVPFKESKLDLDTILDEKIVKKGSKWQVQSEKGRNMGTYDTKAGAEKRLQQVHYFKHANEDLKSPLLYQLVGLYNNGNLALHVAFSSFDEAFKTGKRLIENEPDFQELKLIDYNTKETLCDWMWIPGFDFWQFSDLSGMASPEKDLSEDTSKHIYGHNWGWISDPCFEKTDFKENKQEVADWWNKHMAEAQDLSDDALIEWAENTEDYLTDFAPSAYYVEEEIQEMINEIKSYKVTDLSESILDGEFYLRFDKKTTKNSAYYAYLDYQGHIHWTKDKEKATKFNYDGIRQIIEQAIEECKKVFFDSKKDRDYFEKNYGYYLAPVKVGDTNVDLSESLIKKYDDLDDNLKNSEWRYDMSEIYPAIQKLLSLKNPEDVDINNIDEECYNAACVLLACEYMYHKLEDVKELVFSEEGDYWAIVFKDGTAETFYDRGVYVQGIKNERTGRILRWPDDYKYEIDLNLEDKDLSEAYKTAAWNDAVGHAGYILDDGSLYILDEYHGEDPSMYEHRYPEFSNTHPEEDTCIRLYKEPNAEQYETLMGIMDRYFENENYCKVEIWNPKTMKPDFYKILSCVEGACEDTTGWEEIVRNWHGDTAVQLVIKAYFKHLLPVDLSEDDSAMPKYFYISFRQHPETKEDDLYYLGPNYKERNLKKKFSRAYWTQNRDEMHVFDYNENWWKIREEAIERFNNEFDIEMLGIKNINDLSRHIGVRNYTDNNKVDLSEKFQEGFKADAIKEDKLEGMYEEMLEGQWNPQDKIDVKDYLDMLTDWSTGAEEIKESWLWREALQDEYKQDIEKLEKESNKSMMQAVIKDCIRDIMFGYRFWEMNNEDLSEKLK